MSTPAPAVEPRATALKKVVHKSTDFWLDDRDVVLYTVQQIDDDTEVYTMYGVRKSTLSMGSGILDFTFNTRPDVFTAVSETYEGLPTMQLVDDDPADVEMFLNAIYRPGYLQQEIDDHTDAELGLLRIPPSFPGVLRLAEKLDAPRGVLRSVAKAYQELWPSDMHKFFEREYALGARAWDNLPHMGEDTPLELDGENTSDISKYYPDPVTAYTLAKKQPAIHSILPVLAYDIAHARRPPDSPPEPPFTLFRQFDLTRLSTEDMQSIERGIKAYHEDCKDKFGFGSFMLVGWPVDRCRRSPYAREPKELTCFNGMQEFWARTVEPFLEPTKAIDLRSFPRSCSEPDVCASCASAFIQHLENARYAVWHKLPGYFDLAGYVDSSWGEVSSYAERPDGWEDLPTEWQIEITAIWNPEHAEYLRTFMENAVAL
ncbi:unnamed protein product [Peniophora sp. CBMAI 1063]|nr:unnamed protein product [Peniophora sp. CBMAI 1063]